MFIVPNKVCLFTNYLSDFSLKFDGLNSINKQSSIMRVLHKHLQYNVPHWEFDFPRISYMGKQSIVGKGVCNSFNVIAMYF